MLDFNKLDTIDPPDVDQTQFGSDMKRWLANLVDVINSNFLISNLAIQYFENLITAQGVNAAGAWPLPFTVPVIGLTSTGFVTAKLISSSLPTEISSIVPSNNSFDINFSLNPGASAIIVYQAFISKPQ